MDVAFRETGNGGDVTILGNDLKWYYHGENNIYFGLFGGNVLPVINKFNEDQNFEWWGNKLFMNNNTSTQMVSDVERAILDTPLTSAGRVKLENAVKTSLKFLSPLGDVQVTVTIVATNRVDIFIKWFTLEGIPKSATVKYGKTPDGDFFELDFNDDFL